MQAPAPNEQIKDNQTDTRHNVPQPNEVERYARQLCRHWGDTRAPVYHEQSFVRGFADFMQLIVRIQVKHAGESSCPKKPDHV